MPSLASRPRQRKCPRSARPAIVYKRPPCSHRWRMMPCGCTAGPSKPGESCERTMPTGRPSIARPATGPGCIGGGGRRTSRDRSMTSSRPRATCSRPTRSARPSSARTGWCKACRPRGSSAAWSPSVPRCSSCCRRIIQGTGGSPARKPTRTWRSASCSERFCVFARPTSISGRVWRQRPTAPTSSATCPSPWRGWATCPSPWARARPPATTTLAASTLSSGCVRQSPTAPTSSTTCSCR